MCSSVYLKLSTQLVVKLRSDLVQPKHKWFLAHSKVLPMTSLDSSSKETQTHKGIIRLSVSWLVQRTLLKTNDPITQLQWGFLREEQSRTPCIELNHIFKSGDMTSMRLQTQIHSSSILTHTISYSLSFRLLWKFTKYNLIVIQIYCLSFGLHLIAVNVMYRWGMTVHGI